MLWMVSLSFKNEIDNIAYPPIWIPRPPTLANYRQVFERSPFGLYTVNSIIVSGSATLIGLMLGVPAAYGIAKGRALGMAMLIMLARITPGLSYLIPLFTLFRFFRLTGTLAPVAITHLVITIPMIVWVMISFFEDMHPELEEAALVDGCSIWRAFVRVSLPLAQAGHRRRRHPGLHPVVEQLHLRRRAGRPRDAHAARGRVQLHDLRAVVVGAAGGSRPDRDAALAAADHLRPARHRHRTGGRRGQGLSARVQPGRRLVTFPM